MNILLNHDEVELIWPSLVHDIEKIRVSSNGNWTVDDVKECLVNGVAQLAVGDGWFAILRLKFNRYTKRPTLWIWILCSYGQNREKYQPAIERIARDLDAEAIEMCSTRSMKAMVRLGWKVKDVTYTREVSNHG